MFSPAQAITAGALIFAVGGALLITQPFNQQTSTVPGAESDTEPAAPVEFTGRWEFGSQMQSADVTFEGGVTTARGGAWRLTASEVSDPRFDGGVVVFPSSTVYGGGGVKVWNRAYRVQNADGAWQGYPTIGLDILDPSGPMVSVFYGEGAYEGLDAVVELTPRSTGWDFRGVILDGGLPPAPEAVPFE